MAGVCAIDLQELAETLLNASIEALDTIPLCDPALDGAPERAFVAPGRPALEGCDQLVVHVDFIQDAPTIPGGLAAGRRNITGKMNQVGLVVTIDRCVIDRRPQEAISMLEPARPADLQETAEQTNADAWALWNHLYNLWRAELLFTVCAKVFFDGMRALPEEGGRAGWTLALRVVLDGYEEFPAS